MKVKSFSVIVIAASFVMIAGCERKDTQVEELQSQLKAVNVQLQKAQEKIAALEKELAATQNRLSESEVQKTKSQAQTNALSTELAKIRTNLAESSNANNMLNNELAKVKEEIKRVTLTCDNLRENIVKFTKEKTETVQEQPRESGIITYENKKKFESTQAGIVPEPNQDEYRLLTEQLQQAESYVQSGNWQAAEQLLNQITSSNPNFPGLDALRSRIANMKAQQVTPNHFPNR